MVGYAKILTRRNNQFLAAPVERTCEVILYNYVVSGAVRIVEIASPYISLFLSAFFKLRNMIRTPFWLGLAKLNLKNAPRLKAMPSVISAVSFLFSAWGHSKNG